MTPIQPKKKPLTKTEKEILRLITQERLNMKQICIRRQCTHQAVYKHVKSLKKKGALDLSMSENKMVANFQSSMQPNDIRLHGQEFNIKILWQDQRYQESQDKSNIFYLEGSTVRLYKNSIEIYAGEGISFFGKTTREVERLAGEYWQRFFTRLEHDLKIIIIKDRARNIKQVNAHYARGESEICENALEKEGKKIKIFCPIDGKLWFVTDESFGGKEDETLHPGTGSPDRVTVDNYVNDWRSNKPPTNSQLAEHIFNVSSNQEHFAKHLKSHVKSVQDLGSGVSEMNSEFAKGIQQMNTNFVKQMAEFSNIVRKLKDSVVSINHEPRSRKSFKQEKFGDFKEKTKNKRYNYFTHQWEEA